MFEWGAERECAKKIWTTVRQVVPAGTTRALPLMRGARSREKLVSDPESLEF